jgi:DNA-binding NarL/FixJ family response regulator
MGNANGNTNGNAGGASPQPDAIAAEAVTIVVADDHPLFRNALREAIAGMLTDATILEAATLEDATGVLNGHADIDLLLLDLSMPGMRGFSGLTLLRNQFPTVPVLIVSANDDPSVMRRCLAFGAAGYLPKTQGMDQMKLAIRTVLDGGTWMPPDVDATTPADRETSELVRRLSSLTPQQMRVLMMLSEGKLNKQIAYELDVSEATVKAHVSAILTKLRVESRTQAVIAANRIEAGNWQMNGMPH